jgi:ribosomal protein S8
MTKKKTLRHRGVVSSDSISEMIAQIQNGLLVGRNSIAITRDSTTMQVANILLSEGYIEAILNSSIVLIL